MYVVGAISVNIIFECCFEGLELKNNQLDGWGELNWHAIKKLYSKVRYPAVTKVTRCSLTRMQII